MKPIEIINYEATLFNCRKCKKTTANPIVDVMKGSLTDFQEVDIVRCRHCGLSHTMFQLIKGSSEVS